eukprot:6137812-Alexandrium_andersonii.AAC.2
MLWHQCDGCHLLPADPGSPPVAGLSYPGHGASPTAREPPAETHDLYLPSCRGVDATRKGVAQ